jgi:carboxypeptidase C (cathepsin A)
LGPKTAPEVKRTRKQNKKQLTPVKHFEFKKKNSNEFGNLRWVLALPWSGRYDFEDADFQDWSLDDGGEAAAPAGQVKGDGSALSFVRVLGAGHMVPMDQPAAALKMITAFTRGEKIASTGGSISKKGGGAAAAVA